MTKLFKFHEIQVVSIGNNHVTINLIDRNCTGDFREIIVSIQFEREIIFISLLHHGIKVLFLSRDTYRYKEQKNKQKSFFHNRSIYIILRYSFLIFSSTVSDTGTRGSRKTFLQRPICDIRAFTPAGLPSANSNPFILRSL